VVADIRIHPVCQTKVKRGSTRIFNPAALAPEAPELVREGNAATRIGVRRPVQKSASTLSTELTAPIKKSFGNEFRQAW
jgi:hypothetical protein